MSSEPAKDLVALVADKYMEFTVRGLLTRHSSLGIRPISADIFVHPERDPGCFLRGHDFLRPTHKTYDRAIVLFDREGSGRESQGRLELEESLEERLAKSGWERRSVAIAIDPEIEAWVWSNSPHVDEALGWRGRVPNLRSWLRTRGLLAEHSAKPERPKEAVEGALREARKPRSPALYFQLAQRVTLDGCSDSAFQKLRQTLAMWFGVDATNRPAV